MTKLQKLIDESGMTRYEISKRSGVLWTTLNKYVQGRAGIGTMPVKTVIRLSKVFGMTVEEFVNATEDVVDTIDLKDGWNHLDDFDIYVENGSVVKGTLRENGDMRFIEPCVEKDGGYKSIAPVKVKDYIELSRQEKIKWC